MFIRWLRLLSVKVWFQYSSQGITSNHWHPEMHQEVIRIISQLLYQQVKLSLLMSCLPDQTDVVDLDCLFFSHDVRTTKLSSLLDDSIMSRIVNFHNKYSNRCISGGLNVKDFCVKCFSVAWRIQKMHSKKMDWCAKALTWSVRQCNTMWQENKSTLNKRTEVLWQSTVWGQSTRAWCYRHFTSFHQTAVSDESNQMQAVSRWWSRGFRAHRPQYDWDWHTDCFPVLLLRILCPIMFSWFLLKKNVLQFKPISSNQTQIQAKCVLPNVHSELFLVSGKERLYCQ